MYQTKSLLSSATFTVVAPDADVIRSVEGPNSKTSDDIDSSGGGSAETLLFSRPAAGEYKVRSVATHPSGRLLWGSHAGTTHFYGPAAPDEDTAAFLRNYEGQAYYYFSGDAGKTWEFIERRPHPDNPEAGLPNSGFSDPEFAIDKAGQVYFPRSTWPTSPSPNPPTAGAPTRCRACSA